LNSFRNERGSTNVQTSQEFERPPNRRARPLLIRDDRLIGVDMRSREGRRFREILKAAVAEFGEGDPIRVAEIARLRLIVEKTQTDLLAGKAKPDDLVRVSRLTTQRERGLREHSGKAAPAKRVNPLAEHFSRPPARSPAP
jgi:hypothetical protein